MTYSPISAPNYTFGTPVHSVGQFVSILSAVDDTPPTNHLYGPELTHNILIHPASSLDASTRRYPLDKA
jgi:hypothetical protein